MIANPTARYLVQVYDPPLKTWVTLDEWENQITADTEKEIYQNRGLYVRVVDTFDELGAAPTRCELNGHNFPGDPDGTWTMVCSDCGDPA